MKSFRKLNLMFVMAFALLLLTACGGAAPEPEAAPEPAATEEPAEEPAAAEEATEEPAEAPEAAEDATVTMVSWGGAYQEAQTNAYLTPYEEETGVKIVQDGPTDYAKIIAMVEAGQVTWDVVDIENDFAVGKTEQYFEPLDYSIIPKDEILPGLADEYRVGSILYATVLGYNTDEFSEAPQGWADFFDMEKFPGTRSLPQTASRYVMEVALVADGVDPDDLYPLDIDRALGVLDKIKDDVIYWETGSQSAQQLADEEAVMGMLWNGRIQTAIDEGAPLAIQWNQHVALPDYFAVPKGAPNKDEAMKLIAYMVSEEHNHKISDFISYAPINVKTFDKVNPEMAPLLPTYEDRPAQGFQVSDAWWDDNRDVVSEAYNAWLLGEEVSAVETSDSEGTGTVTMVSWGGAYQEAQTNAYLTPYEEETGVKVVQDGPTDYAKIIAMVEAGQVAWDVVDIENDFAVGQTEQYFEPIDYSIVPKDEILPGLADEYRVGSILYATVLGYNTDEFSEAPEGWADFFDQEKFPGTRSLPQTASRYVMEVALVADGVDPADLYPLDVNRALGVLDTIKDDVIFWETGSQSAQQLADEEAVMGMLWNGRIQTAIDEGAPLAIQWNQHVALPDYFAVPKGAKNKVEAMKLIAYMVSEEHNHKISDFISYAPVNVKTFDKINPDMAPVLPTYEDRPSLGFQVSDAWWDENRDVVSEAYNAWLLGEEVSAVETTDLEGTGTVTMVSWGGAYQEAQTNAYLTPYEEETGVKVVQDGPTDYAKIIAMVEAGQVAWDVVDIENDFAVGQTEQYFEPIDYSIVPKDEILPGLADEYRVGSILYATVLGYNTDEFSEAPEGWADFFDQEKFPGTRSLPQTASRYVMEVALISDGVEPDDLYPLDIDRALGVLDKIKDDVIFWETGSQSAQQLADEEAVMGMLWNGRIQTAIDEGAPLAIQWNQHVALPDYFAVPKGAKNKVEAMKLIAYMVSEEHNHKISDFISYAPVNVKTFDKINPDMAPLLPTYEDRPSLGFQVSDAWWDDNRDEVSELYNAWLLE